MVMVMHVGVRVLGVVHVVGTGGAAAAPALPEQPGAEAEHKQSGDDLQGGDEEAGTRN